MAGTNKVVVIGLVIKVKVTIDCCSSSLQLAK